MYQTISMEQRMNRHEFENARRFAETSFGKVAYVEFGAGQPAVFCHAAVLNGYQWRDVLDRCARQRRVIAFDNMGHGHTAANDGAPADFAAHARMIHELLDDLDLRRVDLVGSDSGGAIAQTFAANHPERVRSLALANCDARDSNPPPGLQPLIDAARAGMVAQLWSALLADVDLARQPDALGGIYERPESITAEMLDMYLSPVVANPATVRTLERFLVALAEDQLAPIEARLRQLDAPTLIAWGTADTTFELERAHWLAETIPGARPVVEIEGAKLMWPEERPAVMAELLVDLWSSAS
jgi:pimeloyl-ACP methyl ester carboxylesterase